MNDFREQMIQAALGPIRRRWEQRGLGVLMLDRASAEAIVDAILAVPDPRDAELERLRLATGVADTAKAVDACLRGWEYQRDRAEKAEAELVRLRAVEKAAQKVEQVERTEQSGWYAKEIRALRAALSSKEEEPS